MLDALASTSRLVPALVALACLAVPQTADAQTPAPRATSSLIVAHPQAQPAAAAARIELAVESVASTATGAQAAGELSAQRVVRALVGSGIPLQEIRVLATYLVPDYADPGVVAITTIRQDRRVVGYRAVTGITVHAADARHAGLLVDLAHGAGAHRVLGVHISDVAALKGN